MIKQPHIIEDGEIIYITNVNKMKYSIDGDISNIYGNVSGIRGNVSGIRGNVSGIYGDVSGIRGDVSSCDITEEDRRLGIDIQSLINEG